MDFCTLEERPHLSMQVAELLYSEWELEFRMFDGIATLEQLEDLIRTYQVYIATLNDEVIGVATICPEDWGVRRDLTPWLGNLFVKPQYRRMGLGKALVRYVLEQTKNVLYLWTYREDLLPFYENMGFRILEYIDNYRCYKHIYVMYYRPRVL